MERDATTFPSAPVETSGPRFHQVRGRDGSFHRGILRWMLLLLLPLPTMSAKSDHFLEALAQIESGGRNWAVGADGEIGMYQLTMAAWSDHSSCSFSHAKNPELAGIVALKIRWSNQSRFRQRKGRPPSLAEEYAMYNCGFAGFLRYRLDVSKMPPSLKDRCERFARLHKAMRN